MADKAARPGEPQDAACPLDVMATGAKRSDSLASVVVTKSEWAMRDSKYQRIPREKRLFLEQATRETTRLAIPTSHG